MNPNIKTVSVSNKLPAILWLGALLLAGFAVVFLTHQHMAQLALPLWATVVVLIALSGFCEYIDSSIGMGYGTTLVPLLLLFGIARHELVPAILLSEFLTGFFSSIAHHKEGNVNLKLNKNIHSALWLLGIPTLVGVGIAVIIGSIINLQLQNYLNIYIGLMITGIGAYLLYSHFFSKRKNEGKLNKKKLFTLGLLAAFNKGISGGGYGPLMTGGQLVAGVKEREAIVITSLCECLTCGIGFVMFLILGGKLNLTHAIPLCIGSMLTVIPAAKTVKIISPRMLKNTIGWATLLLGCMMLWKLIL